MEEHKELRKIVLIITQSCNLDCTYCYEQCKSNKKMSFEMAKSIIDEELKKYGETHSITIEFFGGEPFMNFPLIVDVCEYVSKEYCDKNIQFCTTTNGTLINDRIKEWLVQHKDNFECALSLDGTKKMHDINRRYPNGTGSYDDIDIEFFLDNYISPRAKMTVSQETLPYLSEGVKHLDKLGFHSVVDLASNENYWSMDNIETIIQQLNSLVDYYTNNDNQQICRMVDYDLLRIFIDKDEPFQYCGAGKNMVTYDVDGSWYPCMALAPVSKGLDSKKFEYENFETFKFNESNICRNCELLRLCRNCYAANYNQTHNVEMQTPIQCYINRLTLLASSRIQYNRIMKQYENTKFLSNEDNLKLQAILKLQEVIKFGTFIT